MGVEEEGVEGSSSRYGVKVGVDGTVGDFCPLPLAGSSSRKTTIVLFGFSFDAGTGGGGISAASAGSGSLYTAILDPETAAALLCVLPACLRVVPAAFFTSGMFSLIRDLRVPSSGHGDVKTEGSFSACADSAPEGSTNICIRPFGRGAVAMDGAVKTSWGEVGLRVEPERVRLEEGFEVSASAARREPEVAGAVDDSEGTAGGMFMEDIMRFWKSRCLFCSRSNGAAFRAMPNRYASSASVRLHDIQHSGSILYIDTTYLPARSRTVAYSSYSSAWAVPISLTKQNL